VLRAFVKSASATTCYRRSDAMWRNVGDLIPPRRSGETTKKPPWEAPYHRPAFPGANRRKHRQPADNRDACPRKGAE